MELNLGNNKFNGIKRTFNDTVLKSFKKPKIDETKDTQKYFVLVTPDGFTDGIYLEFFKNLEKNNLKLTSLKLAYPFFDVIIEYFYLVFGNEQENQVILQDFINKMSSGPCLIMVLTFNGDNSNGTSVINNLINEIYDKLSYIKSVFIVSNSCVQAEKEINLWFNKYNNILIYDQDTFLKNTDKETIIIDCLPLQYDNSVNNNTTVVNDNLNNEEHKVNKSETCDCEDVNIKNNTNNVMDTVKDNLNNIDSDNEITNKADIISSTTSEIASEVKNTTNITSSITNNNNSNNITEGEVNNDAQNIYNNNNASNLNNTSNTENNNTCEVRNKENI